MIKLEDQNPDNIVRNEFTTEQGRKFVVAYDKSGEPHDTEMPAPTAKNDGWVKVSWPVGFDNIGHLSDLVGERVQSLGIYYVWVNKFGKGGYDYVLNFINERGWGFQFKDEAGDVYTIATVRNGQHYLLYNSDKPTIVGVK